MGYPRSASPAPPIAIFRGPGSLCAPRSWRCERQRRSASPGSAPIVKNDPQRTSGDTHLTTRERVKVKDGVDAMFCAYVDDAVEVLEPFMLEYTRVHVVWT
jgi:hypothetical protein